jgi:enamine deaminase RidA (YjgF/YER057c/UK114 family)
MTTNSTTAEDRLAKRGIHLPDAPTPFGVYAPAVHTGNLPFLSGMLATSGDQHIAGVWESSVLNCFESNRREIYVRRNQP